MHEMSPLMYAMRDQKLYEMRPRLGGDHKGLVYAGVSGEATYEARR